MTDDNSIKETEEIDGTGLLSNIGNLVKAILIPDVDELVDEEDLEPVVKEPPKASKKKKKKTEEEYNPLAVEEKKEKKPAEPVQLPGGHSMHDAVIIGHPNGFQNFLIAHFGSHGDDWTVLNERTFTARNRKRYKVVYVRDANDFSYNIWFDVSALSLLS